MPNYVNASYSISFTITSTKVLIVDVFKHNCVILASIISTTCSITMLLVEFFFKSIKYWHPSILTYDSYYVIKMSWPWWRHQMETFSALLAICAGNSLVFSEFPAQRPVTRSFDVFFDSHLNKQLSKQSWAGDLIRYRAHYDVTVMQWCDFIPHHIKCIYIYCVRV